MSVYVRGARQELGGRGSWSLLQRHREKQETNGGGSRGQCQGARHQARMAGRAASGGGAGKGTRGQQDGGTVPSVHPDSHSEGKSVPQLPRPFPCGHTVSFLSDLSELLTPTPILKRIFFFLKGPGGVGWLVDDEVSACTHRGFCLPWRVKPRLSESTPHQHWTLGVAMPSPGPALGCGWRRPGPSTA